MNKILLTLIIAGTTARMNGSDGQQADAAQQAAIEGLLLLTQSKAKDCPWKDCTSTHASDKALTNHLLRHVQELKQTGQPFVCSILPCNKTFKTASGFRKHVHCNHLKTKITCPHCHKQTPAYYHKHTCEDFRFRREIETLKQARQGATAQAQGAI